MAIRVYSSSDGEVAKFWSKRVATEALRRTQMARFLSDSEDALGSIESGLSKGAGDRVTITLVRQLTGAGVTESMPQEGNEEAIVSFTDNVTINELSHAVRQKKGIVDQRIPWSVGTQMNDRLADWWADRMDTVFFNHLCGNTLVTDERYTGFNAINAPSSGRIIRAGAHSDDDSLVTANIFTLDMIDQAVEVAKTGGSGGLSPIRPIRAGDPGQSMFALFLHPTQVTQLRTSSGSRWFDIQRAAIQGGAALKDSPLMKGIDFLGMYNNTMIYESSRVTGGITNAGVAKASTRRAVFCGAQALAVAFGKGYGPDEMKVKEETFDYGREAGQNAINIFGMKATRYNSSDFGKIVLSTFAADAA